MYVYTMYEIAFFSLFYCQMILNVNIMLWVMHLKIFKLIIKVKNLIHKYQYQNTCTMVHMHHLHVLSEYLTEFHNKRVAGCFKNIKIMVDKFSIFLYIKYFICKITFLKYFKKKFKSLYGCENCAKINRSCVNFRKKFGSYESCEFLGDLRTCMKNFRHCVTLLQFQCCIILEE